MGKLFGTDGIRGVANTELTAELALKVGKAAAKVLVSSSHNERPCVLIGMDTRISGDMLANALTAGFCSMGVDVTHLGVIPTPGVAYLVKKLQADAGVVISASHNPFEYNGIKIFNGDGFKLSDALEDEIEKLIFEDETTEMIPTGENIGRVYTDEKAINEYVEHLKATVNGDLSGLKIALDCANGAAFSSAQLLFEALDAQVLLLHNQPDGCNINLNCGSTDMEEFSAFVLEQKCDLGFAFDGDADRCLAVDECGNLVDGDNIMSIISMAMKREEKLKNNTVVATVMSNLGFFKFAINEGIGAKTTKVGDRYVLEEMLKGGFVLGGEQSGHIIFLEHATTGDGQLTAVQLATIAKKSGKPLSELSDIMTTYPQVLINVKVSAQGKEKLGADPDISRVIERVRGDLGDEGRVLVRASGTEPLIRVMLEGEFLDEIEPMANEIADMIAEKLT